MIERRRGRCSTHWYSCSDEVIRHCTSIAYIIWDTSSIIWARIKLVKILHINWSCLVEEVFGTRNNVRRIGICSSSNSLAWIHHQSTKHHTMIDKATSLRLLLHRNANLIQVFITHEIILFSLLSSPPSVIAAYTSKQLYFLLCRHAPIVFGVCRCGLRSIVIIVVQIGCIEREIIRWVA